MSKLAILFFLSVFLVACEKTSSLPTYQPPTPATMQETNDFSTALVAIGEEIKQLGVPDELFSSKRFKQIYESPQGHFAATLAVIARTDLSAHHKKIVGFAMQRLSPERFVVFVSALADSVARGQTDMAVLESAAFSPLNFGHQTLIMYYQDAQVQALLERLLQMPGLSPTYREYIQEDLQTGKAKADYLDYLSMIGRPAPE